MNKVIKRGVVKLHKLFSLKADSNAETGIGTLIVFIAMVLVAAVAAAVLVTTAGNLQTRATATGTQTTNQVSTGLVISSIWGNNSYKGTAAESGNITQLAIIVQPNSGSGDINLANTTISITYQGNSAILTYDSAAFNNVANTSSTSSSGTTNLFGNYFKPLNVVAKAQFGVLVLKDVSSSFIANYPVLAQGDEVAILINITAVFSLTGSGLKPGQLVVGSIVPQSGATALIQFTTPLAYTSKVLQLA
ncbi:flagellin [mine drainage metagenome]|uniref:Flagellin n=1 Tax=mine drainage metagenome TaxID=410659 RepID=T1BBR4_9ZZZZ